MIHTEPANRPVLLEDRRRAPRFKNVILFRRSGLWLAWLLAGAYLVLGLAIPLFITLQSSVGVDPVWRAYSDQLASGTILTILGRTLLLAALTTAITAITAFPVAYAMTLMGPRLRAITLALLVFPQLTSFLVRSYAWIGLLGANGPIVGTLNWLGIDVTTLNYTAGGVLLVLVNVFLPIIILTCYVSMSRIDPSHLRAARTLGANHLESFWRVYAPQSKSGLISGAALVFISSAGMYVTPALIGGPAQTTVVTLVVQQVTQGSYGLSPAYPSSLAVILTAVVGLVLILTAKSVGLGQVLGLKTADKQRKRKTDLRPRDWKTNTGIWSVLRRIPSGSGRRHLLVSVIVVAAVILVDGPFIYLIGMSFQPLQLLAFPTGNWSTKWYEAVFTDPSWGQAVQLSVQIALMSTIIALIIGSFLALRTTHLRAFARGTVMATALLPLIVPHVMYATGIYSVFTQFDLIGYWPAIAVVHSILALPYVYVNFVNGLSSYDQRWDQAAYSLGASPWRRLRKVTLPLLRPALITGAFLAVLLSIDEFTVTLFMGGLTFQNLPLKFWSDAQENLNPELAVIGVLLTACTIAIAALAGAATYATRRATKTHRSAS